MSTRKLFDPSLNLADSNKASEFVIEILYLKSST